MSVLGNLDVVLCFKGSFITLDLIVFAFGLCRAI